MGHPFSPRVGAPDFVGTSEVRKVALFLDFPHSAVGYQASFLHCVNYQRIQSITMTTLSVTTKSLVKATVPVLEERGADIIANFYSKLFTRFPVTASFFNRDRVEAGKNGIPPQVAALGGAVVAYAKHIENVDELMPVIEKICHKHVSRNVRAPHYKLVGKCLLDAIGDTLGPEVATEEIMSAWKSAFNFLAETFIATENLIRAKAEEEAGYNGYKNFKIQSVALHDTGAKTFLVVPEDGSKVPAHHGGQYISFDLPDVPDVGRSKTTAALADVSSEHLAFTLFPSAVGTLDRPNSFMLELTIGDVLKVSVPCGTFKIDRKVTSLLSSVVVAAGDHASVGMAAAVAKSLIATGVKNVSLLVSDANLVVDKDLVIDTFDGPLTTEQLGASNPDGIYVTPDLLELANVLVATTGNVEVGNTRKMYVATVD